MLPKILFSAIVGAVIFTSCTTVYKSSQTPDDVYFSPAKPIVAKVTENNNTAYQSSSADNVLRMQIYDYRWRTLDDDYGYSYNYSPYYYATNNYSNYGYYYNPYYCAVPLYYPTVKASTTINSTPRMVNLNSYNNYNVATSVVNTKNRTYTSNYSTNNQYNNSNNGSKVGNILRQVFVVNPSNNNTNYYNNNNLPSPQPSNNNTRTYTPTPAPSSNSGGGGSTPTGGGSGGSVSRPGRGG